MKLKPEICLYLHTFYWPVFLVAELHNIVVSMVCHMLSTFRIPCWEEIVFGSLMLGLIINLLEQPREQMRLHTEN